MIVQKLSGFAKYDLDTKISSVQFLALLDFLSENEIDVEKEVEGEDGAKTMETVKEKQQDQEKYLLLLSHFEKAFKEGTAPF